MKRKFEINELKFDDKGLIPVVVQDYKTKDVVMVAYMNKDSLSRTIKEGKTCFWSRSRQQFWVKGETSGNFQFVKDVFYDCDMDCLLIKVEQKGNASCHTGYETCFYRDIKGKIKGKKIFDPKIVYGGKNE